MRCAAFFFFFFFFSNVFIYLFSNRGRLEQRQDGGLPWRAARIAQGRFPLTVGGTERPVRHEKWSALISARSRLVKGISVEGTSHIGQIKESLSAPHPKGSAPEFLLTEGASIRNVVKRRDPPPLSSHPILSQPVLTCSVWTEQSPASQSVLETWTKWSERASQPELEEDLFDSPPLCGVKKKKDCAHCFRDGVVINIFCLLNSTIIERESSRKHWSLLICFLISSSFCGNNAQISGRLAGNLGA